MNICLIADARQVHCQNWVRDLRVRGHGVRILSFWPADLDGVMVIPLRTWFRKSGVKYVTNIWRVRRIIADLAPDLVVGYYVTGHGLLAATAGRHPLVLASSGDDVAVTPWRSRLMRFLVRWNLSRADLVTAWGTSMEAAIRRLGVPPEKIFTLPRGVDLTRCDPSLRETTTGPYRVVSTRKLAPEYRVDVVIRAFAGLQTVRPDARLTLVGDGDERRRLQALAADLHVGSELTFAGAVPHEAVFDHLHDADVYVSASYSEGVSNSLLEAMACGVFPIVPDIPPNREWVTHGVNGFLFRHTDADRLRDLMVLALSQPDLLDAARLRNFEITRTRADWSRNMSSYERLFTVLAADANAERA